MVTVSMRDMLKAGVHFGHQTRYWNPRMKSYIFGERNRIHIINLEKTLPMFNDALAFVKQLATNHGKLLFVGTKRSARAKVKEQAQRCNMPYVDHRWLGGMLTNYKTIRQSIKRLKKIEQMRDSGVFAKLTKKESLDLTRELEKLEQSIGGIKDMSGLPDAIFVIDAGYENIAIREANRLKIPVIGIVDTNDSPEGVDYLVPANDDATSAIELYLNAIADTIIEAGGHIAQEPEKRNKPKSAGNKKPEKEKKVVRRIAKKADDAAEAAESDDAASDVAEADVVVTDDASETDQTTAE